MNEKKIDLEARKDELEYWLEKAKKYDFGLPMKIENRIEDIEEILNSL